MTSKQIKTGLAKSAGSSPAQSSKISALADPNMESLITDSVQKAVGALMEEHRAQQKQDLEQVMNVIIKRMDEATAKQSQDLQEGIASALNLMTSKMGELEEKVAQANIKTEAKMSEIQNRVDYPGTEFEGKFLQNVL